MSFDKLEDRIHSEESKKVIAIDETKIKINGKVEFLWATVDFENREPIAVKVIRLRNEHTLCSSLKMFLPSARKRRK